MRHDSQWDFPGEGLPDILLEDLRAMEPPEGIFAVLGDVLAPRFGDGAWAEQIAAACDRARQAKRERREKQDRSDASIQTGGSGVLPINTYPMGVPSGIYPCFVGFCGGDMPLHHTLNAARRQCWLMHTHLEPWERKLVLVVTDKWNTAKFRSTYQQEFLRFAQKDNVRFYFYLFTDYDVSRVNFPGRDRYGAEKFRQTGNSGGDSGARFEYFPFMRVRED